MDADPALELREAGEDFDVIVSDIEMPEMNGFEFAETMRSDGRWGAIPIIALSSHATEVTWNAAARPASPTTWPSSTATPC